MEQYGDEVLNYISVNKKNLQKYIGTNQSNLKKLVGIRIDYKNNIPEEKNGQIFFDRSTLVKHASTGDGKYKLGEIITHTPDNSNYTKNKEITATFVPLVYNGGSILIDGSGEISVATPRKKSVYEQKVEEFSSTAPLSFSKSSVSSTSTGQSNPQLKSILKKKSTVSESSILGAPSAPAITDSKQVENYQHLNQYIYNFAFNDGSEKTISNILEECKKIILQNKAKFHEDPTIPGKAFSKQNKDHIKSFTKKFIELFEGYPAKKSNISNLKFLEKLIPICAELEKTYLGVTDPKDYSYFYHALNNTQEYLKGLLKKDEPLKDTIPNNMPKIQQPVKKTSKWSFKLFPRRNISMEDINLGEDQEDKFQKKFQKHSDKNNTHEEKIVPVKQLLFKGETGLPGLNM